MMIRSRKSQKSRSDTAVQGTNDSSILSKCSMSHVGYFHDDFLQYFAAKKARRSPLINRGYYIRAKALDYVQKLFLKSHPGQSKQILSLGAGFDSAYFRLKKEGLIDRNIVYVEIDFPEVVKRKLALIQQSEALSELLGHYETQCSDPVLSNHLVLKSSDYILLGVDLTDIKLLTQCMIQLGISPHSNTLLLSEVVIAYMTAESSTKVISWAADFFSRGVFAAYEQVYPEDGFGKVMMRHFKKLGSSLRTISSFPTPVSQAKRYRDLGWDSSVVVDMNYFYNNCVSSEEKQRISLLEPFDEHEEWQLKSMHYVLITAFKHGEQEVKNLMWGDLLQTSTGPLFSGCDESVDKLGKSFDIEQGKVDENVDKSEMDIDREVKTDQGEISENIKQIKKVKSEELDTASVSVNVMCGNVNGAYCFTLEEKSMSCKSTATEIEMYCTECEAENETEMKNCTENETKQYFPEKDTSVRNLEVSSVRISGDFSTPILKLELSGDSAILTGLKRFGHRVCLLADESLLVIGGFGEKEKQHIRFKDITLVDSELKSVRYIPGKPNEVSSSDLPKSESDKVQIKSSDETTAGIKQSKTSSIPTERLFHSLIKFEKSGRIYLFGGRISPLCALTDLTELLGCNEQNKLSTSGTELESSKMDVVSLDQEDLGQPGFSDGNDTHSRETSGKQIQSQATEIRGPSQHRCKCIAIATRGESPCGRWRHVACAVDVEGKEYMWIQGGVTLNNRVLGDSYLLNVQTSTWSKVTDKTGEIGCLHSHSACVYNNSIIISGGLDENHLPSNHVFRVHLTRSSDSSFEASVTPLSLQSYIMPRYSHTSAIVKDHLILVGGVSLSYPTPGLTAIHLRSGLVRNSNFQLENKEEPLLLHNHQMVVTKETNLLIFGGGGNCFSFGTHFNSGVYTVQLAQFLENC